jgi:hypothetical protein
VVDARRNDPPKDAHHLFRSRVGRDVPVVHVFSEQEVAHASAHDPTSFARFAKALADPDRVAIDPTNKSSEVDFRGHFLGLSRRSALACCWRRPARISNCRLLVLALACRSRIAEPSNHDWTGVLR